jgi:threonine aldolase
MPIELRSDTFTCPTPAMLQAMNEAKVGDDVFGEDETVNALESKTARLFGMEAALFCPSGTMTNQIAIKVHTQPGDEVICSEPSHVYQYEGGGIAFNSGCSVKMLPGNRGRLTAAEVFSCINPNDVHKAHSSLVVLENTCNRGGGACYEISDIQLIAEVCKENALQLHLDGARLWNAMVARQESPLVYGQLFDSISVCLSKGLGAPVGSLLVGTHAFVAKARRIRKVFGGGMRQAGYLAAAGVYALDHHIARLAEDHANAKTVEAVLAQKDWVEEILPVETNILIFKTKPNRPAGLLVEKWSKQGINCLAFGPFAIRLVFHLGVSKEDTAAICAIIEQTH